MIRGKGKRFGRGGLLLLLAALLPAFGTPVRGEDVCARVKIEIRQELTLERQGFDAHMRITNGLSDIALENVAVVVSFTDGQGNPVLAATDPDTDGARFFIRVDRLGNIDDVDGAGTLPPASAADIHWLIVPAPGAANGLASGSLYYVGAVLTYTIDGAEHITEVSPDYIFVKPMPILTLDYFLPGEVFGDDAFTAAIEPPVPYTLGVRVRNGGAGTARGLRIDSAQPRIVDNEQGLPVDFVIESGRVDDRPAGGSLRVSFGDIPPDAAATARWTMRCSLSGHFIDFAARLSHADELGGELTSLIEAVHTHFLVRDVRVDLPGRDGIRDFLARDGGVYRVYESQNTEAEVSDRSASASLRYLGRNGTRTRYALAVGPGPGLFYVRLPDPRQGTEVIGDVLRSDGKRIRPENAWLSKTRDGHGWKYLLNLFDAGGTGRYTITFDVPEGLPRAPVLQFIAPRSVMENEQLSFLVRASDPDGTVPVLSAAPLPAGARFIDREDGSGIFDWTPVSGQAGTYVIRFAAADPDSSDIQPVAITVNGAVDGDRDGIDDNWERKYFGDLGRDGRGDFDGDGFSDLEEYRRGSDPTAENSAPSVPVALRPRSDARVAVSPSQLVVLNSTDADGDLLTYEFEIFTDGTLRTALASEAGVPAGDTTTAWSVPCPLADNHRYTWRVRATDGFARSAWAYGVFRVDTANDAPAVPRAAFPAPESTVCTPVPELEALGVTDADGDPLGCTFEVYSDGELTDPVRRSPPLAPDERGRIVWQVTPALSAAAWYYWRVKVEDGRGGVSRSPAAAFYVAPGGGSPPAPVLAFPAEGAVVATRDPVLAAVGPADAERNVLTWRFELDITPAFDSAALRTSGDIAADGDTASWTPDALEEDTRYFWRVRVRSADCSGPWAQGSFFVSGGNRLPLPPVVKNPGEGAWVGCLRPLLEAAPVGDPDRGALSYEFEVYGDAALTDLAEHGRSSTPQWRVPAALADRRQYFWRARAEHTRVAAGPWSTAAPVFVKTADDAPLRHIRVRVLDDAGTPLTRVRVRAFTEDGRYTGRRARTRKDGVARFRAARFTAGDFLFGADYGGGRFWSDPLHLPWRHNLDIVIPLQSVALTVREGTQPVSRARVKVFGNGRRRRWHARTGDDGRAVFRLPAGTFRFKVRKHGRCYWSAPFRVLSGEEAQVWMDLDTPRSAGNENQ